MDKSFFLHFFAKMKIPMKKETMQIKFEGQEHQIDSNTLISALIHYNTIISESNKELGGGSRSVSVKINAIEKGSFVIDIALLENVMASVFSSGGIGYLSDLVTVAEGVFSTYSLFKGKPIKSKEEEATVKLEINIGGNDNVIGDTIIKVYNQPVVREAISKSIETAESDANVEGMTISIDKKDPVRFERKDFKELIYTDFDTEKDIPNENEEIVDATLVITKLSFEKGATWQFLYNGFKISLVVKDDALMKHIDNGARFAKGDAIKVKMKIVKRYNTEYNAYENKGYKILEFIEHIIAKKPNQANLF